MKFTAALLAAVPLLGSVSAARPNGTSICDYYTTALLNTSNATTQYTLLTLLVNTVVIGNYTKPNMNKVPGILAAGTVNGTSVNLLPYFNGGYASTNRGGNSGVAVNFLDDGGAVPLMMNKPANGTSSNQYKLLTHLYQFFGALLGCSATDYPAYMGGASMYSVHKFMDLDVYQNTYFIQQVGLAAASFGVAQSDITIVANALVSLFNYRCLPAATVIPSQGAQLQSICIASDCPLAANATCASYQNVSMPAVANSSLVPSSTASGTKTGSMTMTGSATGSGSSGSSATATSKAGAEKAAIGVGAGVLGLAALFL